MTSIRYLERLREPELLRLRGLLVEEVVSAVRGDADKEHVDGVCDLLREVELRIARAAAGPPSLQRRVEIHPSGPTVQRRGGSARG